MVSVLWLRLPRISLRKNRNRSNDCAQQSHGELRAVGGTARAAGAAATEHTGVVFVTTITAAAATTAQTLVCGARLMILVSAPTIESPVTMP